jgi:hypothetical protein
MPGTPRNRPWRARPDSTPRLSARLPCEYVAWLDSKLPDIEDEPTYITESSTGTILARLLGYLTENGHGHIHASLPTANSRAAEGTQSHFAESLAGQFLQPLHPSSI